MEPVKYVGMNTNYVADGCGGATAGQTVHRTLAKSRLSNPPSKYPNAEKDQSKRIGLFLACLAEMNRLRFFKTKIKIGRS